MLTEEDLRQLPSHAILAFVARYARRVESWYQLSGWLPDCHEHSKNLDHVITLAEEVAAGNLKQLTKVHQLQAAAEAGARYALDDTHFGQTASLANASVARAIAEVVEVVSGTAAGNRADLTAIAARVIRSFQHAYQLKYGYAYISDTDPMQGADGPSIHFANSEPFYADLRLDFNLLLDAVQSQEFTWNDDTPVPLHFFPVRSHFKSDSRIISVARLIEAKFIEDFRQNPRSLYSLGPREFEELIAAMFHGFGFDVELTAQTRDGGKDIIAIRQGSSNIVEAKYLIECKRYAQERTIGVGIVRSLHGVTQDEKATKGILVTTSHFTRDAREFIERNRWLLEGRDFDGLLEWLDLYQKFRLSRIILP